MRQKEGRRGNFQAGAAICGPQNITRSSGQPALGKVENWFHHKLCPQPARRPGEGLTCLWTWLWEKRTQDKNSRCRLQSQGSRGRVKWGAEADPIVSSCPQQSCAGESWVHMHVCTHTDTHTRFVCMAAGVGGRVAKSLQPLIGLKLCRGNLEARLGLGGAWLSVAAPPA